MSLHCWFLLVSGMHRIREVGLAFAKRKVGYRTLFIAFAFVVWRSWWVLAWISSRSRGLCRVCVEILGTGRFILHVCGDVSAFVVFGNLVFAFEVLCSRKGAGVAGRVWYSWSQGHCCDLEGYFGSGFGLFFASAELWSRSRRVVLGRPYKMSFWNFTHSFIFWA